jgi:plastocyanin
MKYTIITILAAIAVVAGIVLYGFTRKTEPSPVATAPVAKDKTVPAPNKQTTQNSVTTTPTTPKVDVQKLLADNPGAGATQDQLKAFSATVSDASIDATGIDVTSCSPTPAVARVKLGKPLTFKNSDAATHIIVNGKEVVFDVPTGTKTLTPTFPGPGIFGYSCDTKIVGIFLVVP